MTPLDFSRWYTYDERSTGGTYYPFSSLDVEEGDRVGVVLMNRGGPETLDDVEPFLYNLLMDPALLDLPVGGRLRHWLCTALASFWADSVREEYDLIGGSSPLNRLTNEQAESLEEHLNEHFGNPAGVDFRTYVAMRYGPPFSEEAAARMEEDGVDQVVLLPLYPQYSRTTSGSSLAYWKALEETGDIPSWPTTTVFEYAANPKYVQALSERIDEGLQRFPRERREDVQLLFSAHGSPIREQTRREDPYCCLVHATVRQVMQYRGRERPFHTAFQNWIGLRGITPSTTTTLEALAKEGGEAVLVVPLSLATDRLQTSYGLDIAVRQRAEELGIPYYEVTSGLNTHPLFIEALSEAAVAQLELPIDVDQLRLGGDGLAQDYSLRPVEERPRHNPSGRTLRCPVCEDVAEARRWRLPDDVPDTEAVRPGNGRDTPSTHSAESRSSS